MSRLIDADELNELMYHEAFETDSEMQRWDSGCWVRYKMFENNIAKCKPVEAEPIRHAHWIDTKDRIQHECSVCHIFITGSYGNYCSNCGAKMDKEVEHEAD